MNSIIGNIVFAGSEYASIIRIQLQGVGETGDGKLVHVSSLIGFLPRYVSFVLGQYVGDGEPGGFRADEHVVRR